jgi:hypothetical protein
MTCLASLSCHNPERQRQRRRMCDLMFAHVAEGDEHLTDPEFVAVVTARYRTAIKGTLIDPNE